MADILQTLTGMKDFLPEDHDYFTFIKKVVRHRCRQSGINRITTPVIERAELFLRGMGETTDVVEKEMYLFKDKGDREVALRPEFTAGICRAYIEHGMFNLPQPIQLYSLGQVFRYGRPQHGRYRQFNQFNVEIIGEQDAALDAELIHLAWMIYQDLGLGEGLRVEINSIGDPESRQAYVEDLRNFYAGKERSLCEDCQRRLEKNPLRLLDCKEEDCKILASLAPKLMNSFNAVSREHYVKVKSYLDELGVNYVENDKLVRGLDYYTHTVFEFFGSGKNSQSALGGGGRYDGLIELLGGPATPAVGFAMGIERIINEMRERGLSLESKDRPHVFLVQLGEEAKRRSMSLLKELREAGIKTFSSFGKGSIKSQLRVADKLKVPYALILGHMEVIEKKIILRDMQAGKQENLPIETIKDHMLELIGKRNLDTYDPRSELKQGELVDDPASE